MFGDVSDESVELENFGIVMNLEPSLFVYFEVEVTASMLGD
jgi:hypothetical protein